MTMWSYEHAIETAAPAAAVFALYAEVAGWPRWDAGLEACSLDGPFTTGTAGTITVAGFGALPFLLTQVEDGRAFADETPFGPVTLRFEHELEPLRAGGTRIVHRIHIVGDQADLVGPEMGPKIVADVPDAMAALARLAETSEQ
jgi:hypothetical protein